MASFRVARFLHLFLSCSFILPAICLTIKPYKSNEDTAIQSRGWSGRRQSNGSSTGLSFQPANSPNGITCEYPDLSGWEACNIADDRSCWIRNPTGNSSQWDIHTDYESSWPKGVVREYWLSTSLQPLSPDGYVKPRGIVVNGTYPGPVLEACWGDQLVIHVTNELELNGTTIHAHGVRQLHTNEMDGVNAVTQCPIPLGATYTYSWTASQYGNSWYHSHYSLQYADGLAGPLLLHGPSSADWDIALDPIFISDWVHESAFQDFQQELDLLIPVSQSIVVGGKGRYQCSGTLPNSTTNDPRCCSASDAPSESCCGGDLSDPTCKDFGAYFTAAFTRGKRHLLRLVNTSAEAMFIFSIDGHSLRVISTDFVPIQPYVTDSIFLAIGERYEVVVDGNPEYEAPDGNYWMRTQVADLCGSIEQDSSTTGIIRYNGASTSLPSTTTRVNRTLCRDEPAESLVPIVPWTIDPVPTNANNLANDTFESGLSFPLPTNLTHGYIRWSLDQEPLWLDFGDPTILSLSNTTWRKDQAVVPYSYAHGYVYLIVTSQSLARYKAVKGNVPGTMDAPHPMHLHGHNFAILAQLNGTEYNATSGVMPPLKMNNPPRRDTALLDSDGYLVLAFKPDNPGIWLFHCHIAWHISSGLGFQVIERQGSIADSIGPLDSVEDGCQSWHEWDLHYDQNDSGV